MQQLAGESLIHKQGDLHWAFATVGQYAMEGVGVKAKSAFTAGEQDTLTNLEVLKLWESVRAYYRSGARVRFAVPSDSVSLWTGMVWPNTQERAFNALGPDGVQTLFGTRIEYIDQLPTIASASKSVMFGNFGYYEIQDQGGLLIGRFGAESDYFSRNKVGVQLLLRTSAYLRSLDTDRDTPIKYITQKT